MLKDFFNIFPLDQKNTDEFIVVQVNVFFQSNGKKIKKSMKIFSWVFSLENQMPSPFWEGFLTPSWDGQESSTIIVIIFDNLDSLFVIKMTTKIDFCLVFLVCHGCRFD